MFTRSSLLYLDMTHLQTLKVSVAAFSKVNVVQEAALGATDAEDKEEVLDGFSCIFL
jgi:hypothetical protein